MQPRRRSMEETIGDNNDDENDDEHHLHPFLEPATQPQHAAAAAAPGSLTANKPGNSASATSNHDQQQQQQQQGDLPSRSPPTETFPLQARSPATSPWSSLEGSRTRALWESSSSNASVHSDEGGRIGSSSCHHHQQVMVVEATPVPSSLSNNTLPTEPHGLPLTASSPEIHSSVPLSYASAESAPAPTVPLLPVTASTLVTPPLQVAIQLNNIAVAMMSRHCWTQAQATLQDALSMLHTIRRPADTPPPTASAWIHHSALPAHLPAGLTTDPSIGLNSTTGEIPVATPTSVPVGAADLITTVTAAVWRRRIQPLPVPNLAITVQPLRVSLRSSLRSRPAFGSPSAHQHLYQTHALNDDDPWILYPIHFEDDEEEMPKEETAMMLGDMEGDSQIDEGDEEEHDEDEEEDDDPFAEIEMATLLYNAAVVSLGVSNVLKRHERLPVEVAKLRQSAVHMLKMADSISQGCWDLYLLDFRHGNPNNDDENDSEERDHERAMEEEGEQIALPQAAAYFFHSENEIHSPFWGPMASQQPWGMDHPRVVVPVEFAPHRYRILMVQMMAVGQLIPLLYKLGLEQQVRDMESKLDTLQDQLQILDQDLMEIDDL